MLVRNWMQADPVTVTGDTLVSEAKRLLSEHRLHAMPVVEHGRLRGLVTRASLLRMGQFVLRTQNVDEFDFFVKRLKVRDVMLRNPVCMQASDTMEHCLRRGQELGVAQFPVLDGERLVGVISANEIFQLAAHCVGAWERGSGVTLAPITLAPGLLARIGDVAERAGAVLHGLYPAGREPEPGEDPPSSKRVVVRFRAEDPQGVVLALQAAGFVVMESVA